MYQQGLISVWSP